MEISEEKIKLMTSTNGFSTHITIKGEKLDTVPSLKYLGAIVSDKESRPEVYTRIAQTTPSLAKPKPIWNNKSIAISSTGRTDVLPGHYYIPLGLWNVDLNDWSFKKNDTGITDQMFMQDSPYVLQASRYKRGG